MDDQDRRRESGQFVRTQRERLSPKSVGLPKGPARRTPGLRREEVAQRLGERDLVHVAGAGT